MKLPTSIIPKPGCLHDLRFIAGALTIIILSGLTLRSYRLTARNLAPDEAFSWRIIEFPFPEMIQRVGRDNHPPLHFILLQGWMAIFGASTLALRSLSVLFGGLTLLGVYLFAVEAWGRDLLTSATSSELRVRGRSIGLLASAFVALSALQIRYSWEARMYALAAALTVFSSWALFRALRPPSRLRRWLLYGLLALLLAYTHYYGLFTLATQVIFVAMYLLVRADWSLPRVVRAPVFWHALLAAVLAVVGWLPWLPVFLRQRAQVQADFWTQPIAPWDVALLCYQMFVMPEYFPPPRHQQLLAASLCILGLGLLCRKARAAEWYILGSAVAPLLFSWALSAPFILRCFVMAQLFLLIGLAVLIWRLPGRPERALAAAAALIFFAGVYSDFWSALDVPNKPGTRGAAALLHQQRHPGEPVIVCFPSFYFPILHYTPDRAGYYLYSADYPMPHHYGTAALTAEDLITEEQLRMLRSRRVWVVNMASGNWVPVPPKWKIKGRHTFTEVVHLGAVVVLEFETQQPNR